MTSGLTHIEQDHIQVKQFVAQAWHTCFEMTAMDEQTRSMLNPYFSQSIQAMLVCLFSLDTLHSGTMISFSNSVCSTIEHCDGENLVEPLRQVCEGVYNKVNEYLSNPLFLGNLNKEQQEVFLNNWCSVLQPCIVRMGSGAITDQMLQVVVDMAVQVFQYF